MPGAYITAKDLATAAVTFQKPRYDDVGAKAREARIFMTFDTLNAATAWPHALGRVPTGFSVVQIGRAGGSPGTVYADDPLAFSKHAVVLKCTTTKTWADIRVF